jgi:hypothetical protein
MLSMTKSKLVVAVSCTQDMLFEKRVFESVGLKVEVLIQYRSNGYLQYLECQWMYMAHHGENNFFPELKEEGLLKVVRF